MFRDNQEVRYHKVRRGACVISDVLEMLVTADPKKIGGRIRSIREIMGMTQTELGNALGVKREMIRRYESGQAKVALKNIHLLTKIADALSIPGHKIRVADLLMEPSNA